MVHPGSRSITVSEVQNISDSHTTAGARAAERGAPGAGPRAVVQVLQPRGEGTAHGRGVLVTSKVEDGDGGAESSWLGMIAWIEVQSSADVFLRVGCMHHISWWQAQHQ